VAQNLFGTETPTSTDALDGDQDYTLGVEITPTANGKVTFGRWRFPDDLPSSPVVFGVWQVSGTVLLGSATFSSPTAGAWNQVALDIDVLAGTVLRAGIWTDDRYVLTPSYTWPKTVGDLTASASNGWLTVGGGALTYPATVSGNSANYFVDIVFERGSTWTTRYDVKLG
jgi:hypothetical protein